MDPIVALSLTEGVKFLYQQAGEFLSAWRARRRGDPAAKPTALAPPDSVTVGPGDPQPVEDATEDTYELLQELKDLVEPIRDGSVPLESVDAQEAVDSLRELLEALLRAPITLAVGGDQSRAPRTEISDVALVTERVAGKVTGLRVRLEAVKGDLRIAGQRTRTGDVEPGGEVTGVELT